MYSPVREWGLMRYKRQKTALPTMNMKKERKNYNTNYVYTGQRKHFHSTVIFSYTSISACTKWCKES